MYSSDEFKRLDKESIETLNKKISNLNLLWERSKTEKDFMEYWKEDNEFIKLSYEIRLPGLQECIIDKAVAVSEGKDIAEKIVAINTALHEIKDSIAARLEKEPNRFQYRYLYTQIGYSIGICYPNVTILNPKEKKRKELPIIKKHKSELGYDDITYEDGPYGGAFASMGDYYSFIG